MVYLMPEEAGYRSLVLGRGAQDSHFAEKFNATLLDWCRRFRVTRIELTAKANVDGYVWALRGFDFTDMSTARTFLNEAKGKVARAFAELERSGRLPKGLESKQDVWAAAALVDDMASGRRPANAPDIAKSGRAGKWLMLGSSWRGSLRL